MIGDNQKIGVGLICLGITFIFLGIVLLFDPALIAIGNVLFLVGLFFVLGFQRTFTFFKRPDRIRGTVCFFFGIFLVVMRWGLIGIIIEGLGFLNLFGNFFPAVLTFSRQIPILCNILELPGISQATEFLAGRTRPKYSV